jgi:hypothetical protein
MRLHEKLQARVGSLVRVPNIFWLVDGSGWDNDLDRVSVLLDAKPLDHQLRDGSTGRVSLGLPGASVQLLISGNLRWVWVAESCVVFL